MYVIIEDSIGIYDLHHPGDRYGGCSRIYQCHNTQITSIVGVDDGTIVSGDISGVVRHWDIQGEGDTLIPVNEVELHGKVLKILLVNDYLIIPVYRGNRIDVIKLPLNDWNNHQILYYVNISSLTEYDSLVIAASKTGDYIAFYNDGYLVVWSQTKRRLIRHKVSRPVSSIDFHPFDAYIACGLENGQILLWGRFIQKKPIVSTMHWHSSAVRALLFSVDGGFLISGGSEGVVVFWQLATGYRQFLPRLGSPVNCLTCSKRGDYLSVCLANNSIRIVGSVSFKIEHTLRGLIGRDQNSVHSDSSAVNEGNFRVLGNLDELVLVSAGSSTDLHVFDVIGDKVLNCLNTIERNYINSATGMIVSCAAIGMNRMVTLLKRKDGISFMRFWGKTGDKWVIEAIVDHPHRENEVIEVVCNTDCTVVISLDCKGIMKQWNYSEDSWRCVDVVAMEIFNISGMKIEGDWLITVVNKQSVAILDIKSMKIVKMLNCTKVNQAFLLCPRSLLTTDDSGVVLWNLDSCSSVRVIDSGGYVSCAFGSQCFGIMENDPVSGTLISLYSLCGDLLRQCSFPKSYLSFQIMCCNEKIIMLLVDRGHNMESFEITSWFQSAVISELKETEGYGESHGQEEGMPVNGYKNGVKNGLKRLPQKLRVNGIHSKKNGESKHVLEAMKGLFDVPSYMLPNSDVLVDLYTQRLAKKTKTRNEEGIQTFKHPVTKRIKLNGKNGM